MLWYESLDEKIRDYLPDLKVVCDEPMSRHRCILTAGMFERFKAYWNWKILSSNSDVELDFELIDRFADRWDWRELIDRHRDDLLNREFFERYKTYIPASELQHSRLWHNLVDERKLQLAREITV